MKRPCSFPGCPILLDRSGYCQHHKSSAPKRHTIYNKHVRQRDPSLALAHKIRKSAKWLRLRARLLLDQPLCADPFLLHGNTPPPATQVHHIIGLVERPDLWNHEDNLQPLCTACHARIERGVRSSARDAAQSDPGPSSRKTEASQPDGGDWQKSSFFA